uniref:Uncharacterized protein n=1 Tax=Arundo donax TaxID=35708 RepID=A0A0A9G8J5_ARUDO
MYHRNSLKDIIDRIEYFPVKEHRSSGPLARLLLRAPWIISNKS